MRKWIVLLLSLVSVCAGAQTPDAQPPDMTPPKELGEFSWLLGEWEADMKAYQPGSTEAIGGRGTMVVTMALGGRYIRAEHTFELPGMGQMTGLDLTTYDPATKQWHTHWFDSLSPSPMHFVGTRERDTTVAICKDYGIHGMPKADFRATYTKLSAVKTTFLLEMKMGDAWSKLLEVTYTKKP
jgi:hypothetical protein